MMQIELTEQKAMQQGVIVIVAYMLLAGWAVGAETWHIVFSDGVNLTTRGGGETNTVGSCPVGGVNNMAGNSLTNACMLHGTNVSADIIYEGGTELANKYIPFTGGTLSDTDVPNTRFIAGYGTVGTDGPVVQYEFWNLNLYPGYQDEYGNYGVVNIYPFGRSQTNGPVVSTGSQSTYPSPEYNGICMWVRNPLICDAEIYEGGLSLSNKYLSFAKGTTFPSHSVGLMYYHTTSNKLYCSDGAAWNGLW
jgi:hypothetical protein